MYISTIFFPPLCDNLNINLSLRDEPLVFTRNLHNDRAYIYSYIDTLQRRRNKIENFNCDFKRKITCPIDYMYTWQRRLFIYLHTEKKNCMYERFYTWAHNIHYSLSDISERAFKTFPLSLSHLYFSTHKKSGNLISAFFFFFTWITQRARARFDATRG